MILSGGGVERSLAVLEVEEHAHAGLYQLLQGVRRLDGLAPEAALLAHNEDLEGRPRLQRVHQPEEPGPVRELGAGNPVVHVGVLVENGPTLHCGVRAGILGNQRQARNSPRPHRPTTDRSRLEFALHRVARAASSASPIIIRFKFRQRRGNRVG